MVIDDEIPGELEKFLDDTLLIEFAHHQGLLVEWQVERTAEGHRCMIMLNGAAMPSVTAPDDETALDSASVQAIKMLTRGGKEGQPRLAFA